MRPGSSVTLPRSMTLAPPGIPALGPTLTMRPALTTMTGFSIVVPAFGSTIRAARITVVGGAGRLVGTWAPTEYADARTTKADTRTARPMRTIGFTESSNGGTRGLYRDDADSALCAE